MVLYDTAGDTLVTFQEAKTELLAEGWRNAAPGARAEEMDRSAVEDHPCSDCGASSVRYEPFTKYEGRVNCWTGKPQPTYLAFAVCHGCGHWSEF
jgi:hypothetical protein